MKWEHLLSWWVLWPIGFSFVGTLLAMLFYRFAFELGGMLRLWWLRRSKRLQTCNECGLTCSIRNRVCFGCGASDWTVEGKKQ